MNVLSLIKSKSVGAFVGLGVMVLSIVSLVIYLMYATSKDGLLAPVVIVLLVAIIVCEIALFVLDSDFVPAIIKNTVNDFIPIIVAGMSMAAFGCFLITPFETLGSIADYINGGMVMFGNPANFGIIMTNVIIMLVMSVVAIVACFLRRVKKAKPA